MKASEQVHDDTTRLEFEKDPCGHCVMDGAADVRLESRRAKGRRQQWPRQHIASGVDLTLSTEQLQSTLQM